MGNTISDLLKQIALGEDSVLELKDVEFSGNKVIGPHRDDLRHRRPMARSDRADDFSRSQ